jgi:hypothetical protein
VREPCVCARTWRARAWRGLQRFIECAMAGAPKMAKERMAVHNNEAGRNAEWMWRWSAQAQACREIHNGNAPMVWRTRWSAAHPHAIVGSAPTWRVGLRCSTGAQAGRPGMSQALVLQISHTPVPVAAGRVSSFGCGRACGAALRGASWSHTSRCKPRDGALRVHKTQLALASAGQLAQRKARANTVLCRTERVNEKVVSTPSSHQRAARCALRARTRGRCGTLVLAARPLLTAPRAA